MDLRYLLFQRVVVIHVHSNVSYTSSKIYLPSHHLSYFSVMSDCMLSHYVHIMLHIDHIVIITQINSSQ